MRTILSQIRRTIGVVTDMGQNVKVKINIDLQKVGESKITDDIRLFAANDMFRLMSPYVPMDTGMLWQTVEVSTKGVHYKQPYARYQYNGTNFNFSRDKHPLASAEWDKAMLAAQDDKLTRDIQNYINRKGR